MKNIYAIPFCSLIKWKQMFSEVKRNHYRSAQSVKVFNFYISVVDNSWLSLLKLNINVKQVT